MKAVGQQRRFATFWLSLFALAQGCSGSTKHDAPTSAAGTSAAGTSAAGTSAAGSGGAAASGGQGGSSASAAGNAGSAGSTATDTAGAAGAASDCEVGSFVCERNVARACDGDGGYGEPDDCSARSLVCADKVGCVSCVPGSMSCDGETARRCRDDGSGYDVEACDALQGTVCNAKTGRCAGACSASSLGDAYIGCDYFPTVTINQVSPDYHFAVAVANTTNAEAQVSVTRDDAMVAAFTVAANSVGVSILPWVLELKGSDQLLSSLKLPGGAYRLRSTQPVSVYQFNPLEYTMGVGTFSASNDASLLLPVGSWTGKYWVVARHNWRSYRGFYTVTAAYDDTQVTVKPGPIGPGVLSGIAGLDSTGSGTVRLDAGDVFSVYTTGAGTDYDPEDVTGTLVQSNKPVQVIGGHQCTNVPDDITYCDHLEESMFPAETLATSYFVTAPLIPDGTAVPKVEIVRVVATEDATELTYDPPQPGAPTTIAQAGGWVELSSSSADFRVTASKPVSVAQYMEGQNAGGGAGDPAMALAVTESQYRSNYLILAPTNYPTNFVNIITPSTATVTLDGQTIDPIGYQAIGSSGYSVIRTALSNDGDGHHTIIGSKPVGVTVYGYGQVTSYWYPGGLNLNDLSKPGGIDN